MKRTIGLWLVVGCASPAPPAPVPVTVPPPAPTPVASTTPPRVDDMQLAVGEAIVIEGTANGGPSNDALEIHSTASGKFVVIAREEGEATILYNDPSGAPATRGFRVATELCRDRPLHPAVLVDVGGHADLPANAERGVESLPIHRVLRAGARDAGRIRVFGDTPGHGTAMATGAKGDVQLWDVFVGGACADKHYAAVAPSVPPGNLGPNGDGTCVRRTATGRPTATPCPDPKSLESLSELDFSSLACEWAASCDFQGVEGCCVGCTNPFAMKIDRKCALKALRAKTCTDVKKTLQAAGCVH